MAHTEYTECYLKSWDILKEIEELCFPLDIIKVIEIYFPEIVLMKYSEIPNFFENKLNKKYKLAFIATKGNKTIIAYDDTNWSYQATRFAIAHELGHFILEHASNKNLSEKAKEDQASCFARNLLSPIPFVVSRLHSSLQEKFGLSDAACRSRDSFYDWDFSYVSRMLLIYENKRIKKVMSAQEEFDCILAESLPSFFADLDEKIYGKEQPA